MPFDGPSGVDQSGGNGNKYESALIESFSGDWLYLYGLSDNEDFDSNFNVEIQSCLRNPGNGGASECDSLSPDLHPDRNRSRVSLISRQVRRIRSMHKGPKT